MRVFKNRTDAGHQLAKILVPLVLEKPIVLALPRGGVPIASEISKSLNAPLNLLFVKKLGVPWHPELAAGAVCESCPPIFNQSVLNAARISPEDLRQTIDEKRYEIQQLKQKFGIKDGEFNVQGRTVILVDDGIATGATARMGIIALKKLGAKKIILAVPVGARSSLNSLRKNVDEVIAVYEPEDLLSVGLWYEDFTQVTEAEAISAFQRARAPVELKTSARHVHIPAAQAHLEGDLCSHETVKAWVIFSHGSGSSHMSTRNRRTARSLNKQGYGTLLFDLLTPDEASDRRNVFDIDLLSERLLVAKDWLKAQKEYQGQPLVYFGASTGAASALVAASKDKDQEIYSLISRGGRPDMALEVLDQVFCPVLLIVGEYDEPVIDFNKQALQRLRHGRIKIVKKAGHLFEEPGALEEVEALCLEHLEKTIPQWVPSENLNSKPQHKSTPLSRGTSP